jgi:acyl carrier protein
VEDELQKLTAIVRDLFDEYEGPVTRALSARDVEQWDSLANVQFVVLIEQAFGIRFSSAEVGQFKSIGELLDIMKTKRVAK